MVIGVANVGVEDNIHAVQVVGQVMLRQQIVETNVTNAMIIAILAVEQSIHSV
jgi:hypothetical protein